MTGLVNIRIIVGLISVMILKKTILKHEFEINQNHQNIFQGQMNYLQLFCPKSINQLK